MFARYLKKVNTLVAGCTNRRSRHNRTAYLTADAVPESYDNSRLAFYGRGKCFLPPAVLKGTCSNSSEDKILWDPVGVFQFELNLKPKSAKTFRFILGVTKEQDKERLAHLESVRRTFLPAAASKSAQKKLQALWEKNIQASLIKTPNPDLDRYFNVWSKYENRVNLAFGRGTINRGFREAMMDYLGLCESRPAEVRAFILDFLRYQFRDGRSIFRVSLLPNNPHDPRVLMDSALWMTELITSYIKETGDVAILDAKVPYFDPKLNRFDDQRPGSVYEHIMLIIKCLYDFRGRFGLCKVSDGDWNQKLSDIGRVDGISVWLSMALVATAQEMLFLTRERKDARATGYLNTLVVNMNSNLNNYAWNERYYNYAFTDKGEPIGSHHNQEGKLHLLVNVWSVISGVAQQNGHLAPVLKALETLNSPLGYHLIDPPYTRAGSTNQIADLEPGYFENGSIDSLGQAFMVYAYASLGMGSKAYTELAKLLPANRMPDLMTGPPHLLSCFTVGKFSPDFGQQPFDFFNNGISWWRKAVQRILGVFPDYGGLVISPSIPREWEEYSLIKTWCGERYSIKVHNPLRLEHGVARVTVNGKKLERSTVDELHRFIISRPRGNPDPNRLHVVDVMMGEEDLPKPPTPRPQPAAVAAVPGEPAVTASSGLSPKAHGRL
jgi:cellobiose phosphorylase